MQIYVLYFTQKSTAVDKLKHFPSGRDDPNENIENSLQTALVTGGNSGLGYQCARNIVAGKLFCPREESLS